MKKLSQCCLALMMALLFTSGPGVSLALAAGGEEILKATGVQGGLIVHLGCGQGTLTAELGGNPYVVQGLDTDPQNVEQARQHISKLGLYGKISANQLIDDTLPYADSLVNLLVVEKAGQITRDEMLRVLVPQGVLYIKEGEKWQKIVKPVEKQRDEWTHFLHGPDGNPVAKDSLVGPPRYLQWIGTPKFSRGHEQQASFSSCVTAGGRMFFIADEAPAADIRMPAQWKLIARDAFNGTILWKRDMGSWVNHFRRFRSGPVNLQFRLVASDDRVFVTLDFEGPVSVLDAATGKTEQVIKGSEFTKQILHQDGELILVTDQYVGKLDEIDAARRRGEFIQRTCNILKVDAKTGKQIWNQKIDELVFSNVAVKNGRVFAQTPTRVLCLDGKTGKQNWEKKFDANLPLSAGKIRNDEMQWEAPSLLVGNKAVYAADFKKVHVYAVEDGKLLWSGNSNSSYNTPPDMHLVGDLFWMNQKGKRVAFDSLTGKVKKSIVPHRGYMHARCYRDKATEQFLMLGQMGVQILDLEKGGIWDNDWVRGTCQYGVLPANGLLYVPPNCCACNMKTKLVGISALASSRTNPAKVDAEPLLVKGPAYGTVTKIKPADDDWPTFRSSPGRTGATDNDVPTQLQTKWKVDLGGKLSAVVVAHGQVYVSAVNRNTIYALDADTGKTLWTYTAGGPIDTPPTIYQGAAYFGSADGWVYCVRTSDGQLMWRLRVAPEDRLIMNDGKLESAWPVHGSILVHKGELKVAAGRSSYLDGGIRLYRIEPVTGKVLSKAVIFSPTDEGKQPPGGGRDVRGALNDILLADGDDVYMRHVKLNFATGEETASGTHLFSPLGFLDDTWWHRSYWIMGDHFQSHWSGWWRVGNQVPSGRIMSYNADTIYGFGRDKYPGGNTGQWRGGEKYHLFAVDRDSLNAKPQPKAKGKKRTPAPNFKYRWTKRIPLLGTGLVATKKAVFVAGPPDVIKVAGNSGNAALKLLNPEETVAAWQGKNGGILYAASTTDGEKLAQYELPAPTVFDGLAAANGRLYLALKDGSLVCMAGE